MGSLVPFDPLSRTFLAALPPNRLALTQGNGALSVTASSEAVGAEADHMLDDDHATAFRSEDLGGGSVVFVFDAGEKKLVDTFDLGGNNLQPPNGMQIEIWDDVLDGNLVVDSGAGLDCVVREDSDFITDDQVGRLKDRLNISPFRFSPVEARVYRVTIDTAAGNGPDDFLEVAFAAAMLDLGIIEGLAESGEAFSPLSPTTVSVGGGGSAARRHPLRESDLPISFMLSEDSATVNAWIGTPRHSLKVFFWATPHDLASFTSGAFFGTVPDTTRTTRISRNVKKATVRLKEQR